MLLMLACAAAPDSKGVEDSGYLAETLRPPTRIDGADDWEDFGYNVAAGDFDGDGRADAAVAQLGYGSVAGYDSDLFVYTDLPTPEAAGHRIGAVDDRAGWSMAPVRDVDGDGTTDLVLGAPYAEMGGGERGSATLVLGPITGEGALADEAATYWYDCYSIGTNVGVSVGGGGDLTGDGVLDIVVGSTFETVYVASGTARGIVDLGTTAAVTLVGADPEYAIGLGAAALGDADVDGDGLADLVVGADRDGTSPDGMIDGPGAVYVFRGPIEGSLGTTDADVRWAGWDDATEAGGYVNRGGDLDGDGLENLLVRADVGADAGRMGVVGWDNGQLAVLARVEQADRAVPVGDADGDGSADLVVADAVHEGRVRHVWGPVSGTRMPEDDEEIMIGPEDNAQLGWSLAAGDFDGDGLIDVIAGAPFAGDNRGAVWVIWG